MTPARPQPEPDKRPLIHGQAPMFVGTKIFVDSVQTALYRTPMVATNLHYTKGPCRAAQITIRGQKVWAVRCRNETVGIAYGGQGDAELWARSPRLLAVTNALIRAKPHTTAYETALTTAQALVAEIN